MLNGKWKLFKEESLAYYSKMASTILTLMVFSGLNSGAGFFNFQGHWGPEISQRGPC